MKHPMSKRVLHWLTALLFIPMLAGGYFWLRTMPSDDPLKLDALMYHMAVGVLVVSLTVLIVLHISGAFKDRATIKRMV